MSQEIVTQPLTSTAFAPFGDILEAKGTADKIINQGCRFGKTKIWTVG